MNPRNLWEVDQEFRQGRPRPRRVPTEKELEFAKREWLLRFDIANHLGLSDDLILNLAKEMYRSRIKANPVRFTGEETWEECSEVLKATYFNRILPELESYDSKYVITGPKETLLVAKLTNR